MSTVGEAALAEARNWIGTPYVHQAAAKGAGADCLGLLRGVWRKLYGREPEAVPAYTRDWGEPGGDEILMRAALRHMTEKPLTQAAPGDVLLFRMRDQSVAKHLGFQGGVGDGETPSFVHSYSGHGVVESPLSQPWQRRIAARFAFPERGN